MFPTYRSCIEGKVDVWSVVLSILALEPTGAGPLDRSVLFLVSRSVGLLIRFCITTRNLRFFSILFSLFCGENGKICAARAAKAGPYYIMMSPQIAS
jgi:hypothetical protein